MRIKTAKLILTVLLAALVLPACGGEKTPSTQPPATAALIEQPLLQFPGTEWNMTPEEVTSALSIQDAERIENAQPLGERHISFGVKGRELLGEEAVIMFEFYNEYESHYGLRQVCVFYPESTDSNALIQRMTEMLGEGVAPEGKDNMIWISDAAYSDFLVGGQDSFSSGIPAVHITLHRSFSDYGPQYLLPSGDFGENGIVLQFYANHFPLLQLESNK